MAAVVMKVQQVEEFASKKVFGGDTDHGSRNLRLRKCSVETPTTGAVVMKVQQVEESAVKKVFGGDTDHGSK